MLILSNPHNPGGIAWDYDTLKELAEICHKYEILVVSDEIHADLALFGKRHNSFSTVSEIAKNISVTFLAPSKTFNIPGLASSVVYIHNDLLREKYFKYIEIETNKEYKFKAMIEDIKQRVTEILNLENITFEEGVPSLVAELADGGMRDALSILDQVVSYAGDNVTLQHIYDIYGMMSNSDMVEYLTLLAENKTKEVLEMIENYIGKGIDVKRLTYDLMVCLKDAIVYRSTSDESILERINAEHAKSILRYYSTDNALKVTELLNNRDGLMCGICNGFQALVKLGLVPYGKIIDTDENSPTLTFNSIGRHQSKIVQTKVVSTNSPWLKGVKVGDIINVPISHGEGRFIANDDVLKTLKANGQIVTQYVDDLGNATSSIQFNPNNSVMAIEGIVSPDGRVIGKMGHSERWNNGLYKNVYGEYDIKMFKSAVNYFKK